MTKLDLRKELKQYYTAKKVPELINVPEGKFLTILGKGDPNGEEYRQAMQALYSVAYTLKFRQKELGRDFTVIGLEGLWWIDEGVFDMENPASREKWRWKSMIRQPDFITLEMLEEVIQRIREKSGPKVEMVNLETFNEGLSAQILHVGPYSEEGHTINALHSWIQEEGYIKRGLHHEIYLNDPRRTSPEKIKTIIRQHVEKV